MQQDKEAAMTQAAPQVQTQVDVTVSISFEALVEAIRALSIQDKHRLWDIFEEMVLAEEDELMLTNPKIQAEIAQAIADYEAGDYYTIEELMAEMQAVERLALHE
ncbi:MAG: hypothetical protein JW910_13140 [Anaerolineae bacterium]|nr:hypothetical protein [Anaerolineae bacterium]